MAIQHPEGLHRVRVIASGGFQLTEVLKPTLGMAGGDRKQAGSADPKSQRMPTRGWGKLPLPVVVRGESSGSERWVPGCWVPCPIPTDTPLQKPSAPQDTRDPRPGCIPGRETSLRTTHPSMTPVVFMILSASSRNDCPAHAAIRAQSHQLVHMTRSVLLDS